MWYEDLPEGCPPDDAASPDGGTTFYRLVMAIPPDEKDFVPIGRENPNRDFGRLACMAFSLSVLDRIDALQQLLKLPNHRGKSVVALVLAADAGPVKRTGRRRGHYSWWRRLDFDAPAAAEEVA